MNPEFHPLTTWQQNAIARTRAVRDRQIVSRRLVTDRAVVDAVASYRLQAQQPVSLILVGTPVGRAPTQQP